MKLPLYVRTVLVHQSPNEDFIIPVHPSTNAIIVMDVETGSEVGRVSLVDLPKKELTSNTTEQPDYAASKPAVDPEVSEAGTDIVEI
jgi:hypothetical protein